MTKHDYLIPTARKIVDGMAAKPGVRFASKQMAADWIAQVLNGMAERAEFPSQFYQTAMSNLQRVLNKKQGAKL